MTISAQLHKTFSLIITLDRSCRKQSPVAVDAEIKALINENTTESGDIIYTEGSLVLNKCGVWCFLNTNGWQNSTGAQLHFYSNS